MEPWILTSSGVRFELLEPKAEMVRIHDIAHALSNVARFGGHTRRFYSSAQHSVNVAVNLMQRVGPGAAAYGLAHDAEEAYYLDMPTPLKRQLPDYEEYANRGRRAIFEALGLEWFGDEGYPDIVKEWDAKALNYERANVLPDHPQWPADPSLQRVDFYFAPPDQARHLFLDLFNQLVQGGHFAPRESIYG
jgi:hypothetical protein